MMSLKFITFLFLFITSVYSSIPDKTKNLSGNEGHQKWRIGVALYSFNKHPFPQGLSMADSAGVKYVEGFSFYKLGPDFNDSTMGTLDAAGIVRMKQMLREKKITMSSMYVSNASNLRGWIRYFNLGKEFGSEYLVCEPEKKDWDMVDSLAGAYHIKIAIHEHSRALSAYWHPDSVLAAIKGHPNIGACADLGHWARSGLDPVKCLQMLEGHILGIHLKDIRELGNLKADDVIPGTGVIDFKAVVKELKRQHFNGYVQAECEHNMDNNLYDVEQGLKYFNSID